MPAANCRLGMSQRAYAKRVGLSRGGVQKARVSGRLVLHPDGSIDAAASDALRLQATDPAKQRGRHATFAKPVPQEALGAVAHTLREQGIPASRAGDGMTFLQARTADEVIKAQLQRLELQKKRGELVDRARAIALVFRLARQERDAWVGWPARVAAIMAAEVGIGAHSMQTILERHVRDHLEQLAEVRVEFR
jgi:hypothetical protein